MAIYISMDCSHAWDDYYNGPIPEYVGTDREAAIARFQAVNVDIKGMSDEKWHYRYELWEYPDGWHKFGNTQPTLLLVEDNSLRDE